MTVGSIHRSGLASFSADPAGQTIFALASGRVPSAIAVIRVSGPSSHAALAALAGSLPPPRQAAVRRLTSPIDGDLLDECLVLRFDAPHSATGEDVAEIHAHGGRAVVEALLEALGGLPGLRPALPGEFTRRSFANGRMDLTAAEGLADLIEAETQGQRRSALAMAGGGLARQIGDWRQQLVLLSARAEAAIDYADDDETQDESLYRDCDALASTMATWLSRPSAERLKDGVRVVIAGPPNAGKSSLLNALTQSNRAIVTDVAGTTRDHIDVPVAFAGIPMLLTDTAGMRESGDVVERLGVERAAQLVALADIVLWMGGPAEAPEHPRLIQLSGRCDLGHTVEGGLPVSAKTGEGLSSLLDLLVECAREMLPDDGEIALNRRQHDCLRAACQSLSDAHHQEPAILAANVQHALQSLDRLTGRRGLDDMLDALFGRFCLGK